MNSVLHGRAKGPDMTLLKRAIEMQPHLNQRDSNGNTPLHIACRAGNAQNAAILIHSKANVNAQNAVGSTPLILVCQARNYELCVLLLKSGADTNICNDHGNTPLHFATLARAMDVVILLLKKGAKWKSVNRYGLTPLTISCKAFGAQVHDLIKANNFSNALNECEPRPHTLAEFYTKYQFIASGGSVFEVSDSLVKPYENKYRSRKGVTKIAKYLEMDMIVKRPFNQSLMPAELSKLRGDIDRIRQLQHTNLLPMFGCSLDLPHVFIISERIIYAGMNKDRNGSLREWLMTPEVEFLGKESVQLMTRIMDGLKYLHSQGTAHGNLKTTNVLLIPCPNSTIPQPLLTDYGFTTPLYSNFDTPFIQDPSFVAPEVLTNNQVSTQPMLLADMFSYGMVMWEVMMRRVPWEGINPAVIGWRVVIEGKREELPDWVPAEIASLIRACWSEDPQARPAFECIRNTLGGMIFLDGELMDAFKVAQIAACVQ